MLAFLSNGITDIQRPDYIHHFVHEKYKSFQSDPSVDRHPNGEWLNQHNVLIFFVPFVLFVEKLRFLDSKRRNRINLKLSNLHC